jgi:uncharacterized protein DUF4260
MTDPRPLALDRWASRWIRADAAALFLAALWACRATHSSWMWFFALFLVPDLSMLGYLFGSRVGAATYNAGHLYAWPVGLLAAGLTYHTPWATTAALSWIAHIAFDNVVGYGLKIPIGFEYTIYGPIGRVRAKAAATKSAAAQR